MTRDEIAAINPDALVLEQPELDVAIMGMVKGESGDWVVQYDTQRLIEAFAELEGWELDDAAEWVYFNVLPAFMGPGTPVFWEEEMDE